MLPRIGMSGRPMIDQIVRPRSHFDFGSSVPPFDAVASAPAPAPFALPKSPTAALYEAPRDEPTTGEAMDAIGRELSRLVTGEDEAATMMFVEWNDFRGKLTAFLSARKDARRLQLESEILALTCQGREILGRIEELKRQKGEGMSLWNALQEPLSLAQARLTALRNSNPAADLEQSFALPEEIEQWKEQVSEGEREVAAKQAGLAPVTARLTELDEKINGELRTLQTVKEQRRNLRLELVDGVHRMAGSGLQGQPGRTAFP